MNQEAQPKDFELIFEGPVDDSPETLRRVKSSFIADLNFGVAEIQEILQRAPLTILKSDHEDGLSVYYKALKNAGAKVLIVRPVDPAKFLQDDSPEDPKSNPLEHFLSDEAPSDTGVSEEPSPDTDQTPSREIDPPASLSLSLDDEEFQTAATPSPQQQKIQPKLDTSDFDLTFADSTEPAPPPKQDEKPRVEPSALNFEVEEAPQKTAPPNSIPKAKKTPTLSDLHEVLSFEEPDGAPVPHKTNPVEDSLPQEDTLEQAFEEVKREEAAGEPGALPQGEPEPLFPVGALTSARAAMDVNPGSAPQSYDWKPKRKRKFPLPLDLVIPIAIGLVIIAIGNHFIFPTPDEGADQLKFNLSIPQEPNPDAAKKGKPAEKAKVAELFTLSGESVAPEVKTSAKFTVEDKVIKSGTLTLTTPPPPELTPEEVIAKKTKAPWAHKIEVSELKFIAAADGGFSAEGPARVYIEDGETRKLVIAHASVTGHYSAEAKQVTGLVQILNELTEAPDNTTTLVEKVDDAKYKLFVSSVISADAASDAQKPKPKLENLDF